MNANTAFGGKVALLEDHFRQILTVAHRALPAAVFHVCLKCSDMLPRFQHMNLKQKMRTNENEQ